MAQWQGYCPSENTWESKAHLPSELIEEFENPDPGPIRVEEANGNRCRIVQLTFRMLLSNSPSFYRDGKKVSRPVERLRVVFRKRYIAAGH